LHRWSGLKFISLPDDPDFFQVLATKVVPLDPRRSGVEFHKRCAGCGRFESVIHGGESLVLKPGVRIPPRGFVRTDLEFASEDEKFPLILCGLRVGEALKKSRLRGLVLEPLS
jgi:hypothetical protein